MMMMMCIDMRVCMYVCMKRDAVYNFILFQLSYIILTEFYMRMYGSSCVL